ncbi:hypothetical protein PoB_004391200 [Plakobranchus ocellatus]|uniref:Uncharacterized protein n=1 Tax=Plakobranchus ocellatus TaxID=259542 RepID=A0AAV4BD80_9GAST|nr:hypothetical protein PoB_004391200 [Plakobranchus ocellatus]
MASSLRVILAVLSVFLCVAVFNVDSQQKGKDCIVDGRIVNHGTEFYDPPNSCELKQCNLGMVEDLYTACDFEGRCYKLNESIHLRRGMYTCLLYRLYQPAFRRVRPAPGT